MIKKLNIKENAIQHIEQCINIEEGDLYIHFGRENRKSYEWWWRGRDDDLKVIFVASGCYQNFFSIHICNTVAYESNFSDPELLTYYEHIGKFRYLIIKNEQLLAKQL